jgi:nucleotide-binding universal stress UspA family protein
MAVLKRILVATDFGQAADVALNYARELARTFGASLDVLHVCENVLTRGVGSDGFVLDCADLQCDVEQAARKHLDSLLSAEDRTMLHAKTIVVTSNMPALAIVDVARQTKADLIFMGMHGRESVVHLSMGSVADRVVRTAPCPVLSVRHSAREFVFSDALTRSCVSSPSS